MYSAQTAKNSDQQKPQPRKKSAATPRDNQPRDYSIIRISAAEKADRTRRNLCWYWPEKFTREHVCCKKFYALIGEDSDEEELDTKEKSLLTDDVKNMVITCNVSAIHVIGPKVKS